MAGTTGPRAIVNECTHLPVNQTLPVWVPATHFIVSCSINMDLLALCLSSDDEFCSSF